jgi:hypothetical protein
METNMAVSVILGCSEVTSDSAFIYFNNLRIEGDNILGYSIV